jgi:DNA-binding MarR family transcriptional regulator
MKAEDMQSLFDIVQKIKNLHNRSDIFKEMTQREFMILNLIVSLGGKEAGVRLSDIRDTFCISSAAVSQAASTLEEKKFIERNYQKTDRRVVYVKITDEGTRAMQGCMRQAGSFLVKVFEKLSPGEEEMFFHILRKLDLILAQEEQKAGETVCGR